MEQPTNRKTQKQIMIIVLILAVLFVVITSVISIFTNDNEEDTTTSTAESETIVTGESGTSTYVEVETVTGENGENNTLYQVTVKEIINSTTYSVMFNDTEYEVKLIGIEVADEKESDTLEYINTLFTIGDTVYLQYDEYTTNSDGQELCYIWLSTEITSLYSVSGCRESMLQGVLLDNNLATSKSEYPNSRYESTFEYIEGTSQ